MTAHSDREAREEAWRAELARLRSDVVHLELRVTNLRQRAHNMRMSGCLHSAAELDRRASFADAELQTARKKLRRAEGG